MDMTEMARAALGEVGAVLESALPEQVEALAQPILEARHIALFGVGREGLMMRALAMRLFHMGFDVHVVGDMTTPPVGEGDLLIVSAGPGDLSTVTALVETANSAGARTLCITAEPEGVTSKAASAIVHLPAQTMARDRGGASVLPMGSLYEAAMFLFCEIAVLHLRDRSGITADEMRTRHTNLE